MKGERPFMAAEEEEDTERAALLSGRGDVSVSASCCDPRALSIISCLTLSTSIYLFLFGSSGSVDEQVSFVREQGFILLLT